MVLTPSLFRNCDGLRVSGFGSRAGHEKSKTAQGVVWHQSRGGYSLVERRLQLTEYQSMAWLSSFEPPVFSAAMVPVTTTGQQTNVIIAHVPPIGHRTMSNTKHQMKQAKTVPNTSSMTMPHIAKGGERSISTSWNTVPTNKTIDTDPNRTRVSSPLFHKFR